MTHLPGSMDVTQEDIEELLSLRPTRGKDTIRALKGCVQDSEHYVR
jgi:hypothetical protein